MKLKYSGFYKAKNGKLAEILIPPWSPEDYDNAGGFLEDFGSADWNIETGEFNPQRPGDFSDFDLVEYLGKECPKGPEINNITINSEDYHGYFLNNNSPFIFSDDNGNEIMRVNDNRLDFKNAISVGISYQRIKLLGSFYNDGLAKDPEYQLRRELLVQERNKYIDSPFFLFRKKYKEKVKEIDEQLYELKKELDKDRKDVVLGGKLIFDIKFKVEI
jgi:hypothetical protein